MYDGRQSSGVSEVIIIGNLFVCITLSNQIVFIMSKHVGYTPE